MVVVGVLLIPVPVVILVVYCCCVRDVAGLRSQERPWKKLNEPEKKNAVLFESEPLSEPQESEQEQA